MTTATLTAETAAGDLLGELRNLLERHDGASTVDDVRELADELTAALRRTRGRLTRLSRKTAPKKAETPAEPKPAEKVEPSRFDPAILGTKTTRATAERRPDRTPVAPTPKPAALDAAPATPTRVAAPAPSRAGRVVAVIAVLWSILAQGIRRAFARFASGRDEQECIVCGPDCCSPVRGIHDQASPLSATKRSPLDVAAGLQAQKRRDHSSYRVTVLQWELGTRAFQGLELVDRVGAETRATR